MLAAILLMLAAYAWMARETLIKKILVFATVLFYAVGIFFRGCLHIDLSCPDTLL